MWRHTAYGGVFSLDRVYSTLEQVFGPSGPDVDERTPRGESALFAGIVTDGGRLLLDSLVLSSAAWAVGRAHEPGPDDAGWLTGFDAAEATFTEAVRAAVLPEDDDEEAKQLAKEGVPVSRPIIDDDLFSLLDLATGLLGVVDVLAPEGFRVHSDSVGQKRTNVARADFLNSFHTNDLGRVAAAVGRGDCGPALATMLTSDDHLRAVTRLDVREADQEDRMLELLAPSRVPAGRWPSNVTHPLATSQQLAVNTILDQLGDRAGVFAVNGPPGTGKTTMLRELVAALVVERARRLATLSSPRAGFGTRTLIWQTEDYKRWLWPPNEELTGFEMVVASSNNGAVANVTEEIPQQRAIDESWLDEASYLAEHASRVLGQPAWGLVAARLGNRDNCGDFVNEFWFSPPADPSKPPDSQPTGFQDWLGAAGDVAIPTDWQAAVSAFRDASAAEARLREIRHEAYEALNQLPRLERGHSAAEQSVRAATEARRAAAAAATAAERAANDAKQAAHLARERRREHLSFKPGVWEIVFTFGGAIRQWRAEDVPLAKALAHADAGAAAANAAAEQARSAAIAAAERLVSASAASDRATTALTAARQRLAAGRGGAAVPDADWRGNATDREIAAPWLDEDWNAARTRLFLAALDLHAAFIAGAARILRWNLRTAMDLLTGQIPRQAPDSAVLQAWQTLFLVIPVVSTTFASVPRLLGRLDQEALGWLFVDEAGQAAPQEAVGALWRTRRAVVVGDPLQLQPILTVLHTTQAALRRRHGVADTWLPGSTSVQGLADRVMRIGTWLPGPDDEPVWVGAPLRVHRRCNSPMFEVVNSTVYGGLMIHGTITRHSPLTATDSAWVDVTASEARGHWIPAEGDAARAIIEYLIRGGVDPADMMAIAPFRDTASGLRRLFSRSYPQLVCGTVHTAQGKEADVVLFVLGGNPGKPGARQWAVSRPNLFNVAVSRAKQRLYVIGSHGNWARLRYFRDLARELPLRPIRD